MVKVLVVPLDASAESVGARCHLAVASVVRQVSVLEMRSLPLARFTQVTRAGAAVAGEREIGEKVVMKRTRIERMERE